MKRISICFLIGPLLFMENIISLEQAVGAEKKGEYLLPGDIKAGWKVFTTKKCSTCHSIWGEGGKEGPDLGTLPESYVSQSQLAALMWNHWPERGGQAEGKK